ncbi:MAG: leucyl/phenylalanyl-tRNA--protein transferase [Nitrospirota bacterium]|nr:leucyl/phenylalanyl-tRNA--protein transferase [Nitrospirota bacterium]
MSPPRLHSPFDARLVEHAYRHGIFPMADPEDGSIQWYAPDPRAVFELDSFHVPRRLARTVRCGHFEVRVNADFQGTMRDCSVPGPGRPSSWINGDLIRVYGELHAQGKAHSVEAWRDGHRVGGLYGVALGGAFMGESMFSRERDASKVALVFLVERLRQRGFALLDTQFVTSHLMGFGATLIPLAEYLKRLGHALTLPVRFD